mmetsp:Transcript_6379/g.18069  ORF Transcript_6379/g.18069 Transcript_6379/m.18069 type:complete len:220 (-) Transcript_6379:787-1446(-)
MDGTGARFRHPWCGREEPGTGVRRGPRNCPRCPRLSRVGRWGGLLRGGERRGGLGASSRGRGFWDRRHYPVVLRDYSIGSAGVSLLRNVPCRLYLLLQPHVRPGRGMVRACRSSVPGRSKKVSLRGLSGYGGGPSRHRVPLRMGRIPDGNVSAGGGCRGGALGCPSRGRQCGGLHAGGGVFILRGEAGRGSGWKSGYRGGGLQWRGLERHRFRHQRQQW